MLEKLNSEDMLTKDKLHNFFQGKTKNLIMLYQGVSGVGFNALNWNSSYNLALV